MIDKAAITQSTSKLYIVGIGSQYPPFVIVPEKFDQFAKRFYDIEKPGLKKLLEINRSTGITGRSAIHSFDHGFACAPDPPTIDGLELFYREHGISLATQACRKALDEWGGDPNHITHTVAVSCTSQGNPGYDALVNRQLDLSPATERILLHGVGCAGGLAIMRVGAQIASGATARGRPARILAYACELCTPNVRHDLAEAQRLQDAADISIAAVLFSDAAAAFVLCNEYGLSDGTAPLLELIEWGSTTIPNTLQYLNCFAEPDGFRTILTRDVPVYTKRAIRPLFDQLNLCYSMRTQAGLDVDDFDWALHPGGHAVISGVQEDLGITDHHLRATRQIFRTKGNSSSPSVIAVLDLLRNMGGGREHIVATSFGPGLVCEMVLLRRST
ncbi:hypothetical protein QQS21_009971 [Conoideocrella luteorostrata]|uniref:Chalcone synthase n=1 Tax=Conoideocrella luteorostrata TaxID=1105319 RepID=A0AAJ0CG38_9HYPO|nr:hypothetical protein QQS21_009971 [Conoideocrella luteorostrata]